MEAVIRMVDLNKWRITVAIIPEGYPEGYCRSQPLPTYFRVDRELLLSILASGIPTLIEVGIQEWFEATLSSDKTPSDPIFYVFHSIYRRFNDMAICASQELIGEIDVVQVLNRKLRQHDASKYPARLYDKVDGVLKE